MCPIKECKVCSSSGESCNVCLQEKAQFDPKSKSCVVRGEEFGSDDSSIGLDMNVIIIIG